MINYLRELTASGQTVTDFVPGPEQTDHGQWLFVHQFTGGIVALALWGSFPLVTVTIGRDMHWTLHLRSRRRRAQILNERLENALTLFTATPVKAEVQLLRVLDACHLGERQLVTLNTTLARGTVQWQRGRYIEAAETAGVAIAGYDLSDETPARSAQAAVRAELGHAEQAVQELRVVVAECTDEWGTDAPPTLLCHWAVRSWHRPRRGAKRYRRHRNQAHPPEWTEPYATMGPAGRVAPLGAGGEIDDRGSRVTTADLDGVQCASALG
jgi:hypothetical protein